MQRPKTLRRRNAPKAVRHHGPLAGGKETNVARLTRERDEALEQQTATTDILKIISRSHSNIQLVLDTIAEIAQRLCQSEQVYILKLDGGLFGLVAAKDAHAERIKYLSKNPIAPDRSSLTGRVAIERRTIYITDVLADREYSLNMSGDYRGYRTILGVPLLREGVAIGVIVLTRGIVKPFSNHQIGLVSTFADQALIALENARLFDEAQARTRDLSEALDQQTATAEVLEVISSSPGDLEPVFQAMLANATRICGAAFGSMLLAEGDLFRRVAQHNAPPKFADFHNKTPIVDPKEIHDLKRLVETKQVIHIADVAAENPDDPIAIYAGARTLLIVPMLKEDDLIGTIGIYRQEVLPFTDKQIELVQNFAAQAVIAIENARLLNELRQSLEQQTATADVLKVISSSPGELQPVFNAMLENAVRICQAKFGVMHRFVGDEFYAAAMLNVPPALSEFLRERGRKTAISGSDMDRLSKSKQLIHTIDMLDVPTPSPPAKLASARTQLAVPMLMNDVLIGAIVIYRKEVRPFTDKQIELVTNYAAQAVIAIENTRLLKELRRVAFAADRDRRRAQGHQLVARRAETGIRRDAGQCGAHLRRELRDFVSRSGQQISRRRFAQCAARICRVSESPRMVPPDAGRHARARNADEAGVP